MKNCSTRLDDDEQQKSAPQNLDGVTSTIRTRGAVVEARHTPATPLCCCRASCHILTEHPHQREAREKQTKRIINGFCDRQFSKTIDIPFVVHEAGPDHKSTMTGIYGAVAGTGSASENSAHPVTRVGANGSLPPNRLPPRAAKGDEEAGRLLGSAQEITGRKKDSINNNAGIFGKGSRRQDNGRLVTAFLVVNYMIGSGILNTPQTFRDSGLAATTLLYFIACEYRVQVSYGSLLLLLLVCISLSFFSVLETYHV